MRAKCLRCIVTFKTTADAIAVEKRCKENNVLGQLIPVPTSITAGCGMAWSLPLESKPGFEAAIRGIETEGYYEMLI